MRAELRDSEILATLAQNAYSKEIKEFFDKDKLNIYPLKNEVEHDIIHHIYYKLLLAEKIIGGVYIVQIDDITASIEDFCIAPDFQNNGYGTFFLNELERINPNIKKWTLTTPLYSVKNQHLYDKQGYIRIKVDYYDEIMSVYYEKVIK